MNEKNPFEILLNVREANEFVEGLDDPILKSLLQTALYKVYLRWVKSDNQTDEEFERRKPVVPFDMLFYITLVKDTLENKNYVKEILNGNLGISAWFDENDDII